MSECVQGRRWRGSRRLPEERKLPPLLRRPPPHFPFSRRLLPRPLRGACSRLSAGAAGGGGAAGPAGGAHAGRGSPGGGGGLREGRALSPQPRGAVGPGRGGRALSLEIVQVQSEPLLTTWVPRTPFEVSEMRQGRGVRVGRGAGARLPAHASPAGSLTQDCATSPESGFRTVLFGAAPVANPGGRGKGGGVVGIQAVGGPLAELSFAPPPWTGDALWPVGDLGAGTWNAKLAPPQGPLCKQFHLPLPTW